MFGMLKHHLHPGIFLLFMWLCHLMEHQKVQGKPSASVFLLFGPFLSRNKLGGLSGSAGVRVPSGAFRITDKLFIIKFALSWFSPLLGKKPSARIRRCVRKASVKQVPYGTLQNESTASFAALARRAVKPPRCCRRQPQLCFIPDQIHSVWNLKNNNYLKKKNPACFFSPGARLFHHVKKMV